MRRLTCVILLWPLLSVVCLANPADATQKLLEKTVNNGIEILRNQSWDNARKLAEFDRVMEEACHLELMGKLALGRKGWFALSEKERKEFVKAFADLIKRSYYGKLAQLDPSAFSAEYLANESFKGNRRRLKALMKTDTQEVEVVYLFCERDERWAVYDLEVEGISLVASYCSQFGDYLARHTAQELLAEIKSIESQFLPQPGAELAPQGK